MQILKIVLGSTAFFVCLWLTAGLLGDSLLGIGTQECTRAVEAHRGGRSLGSDDVLEAVCLMNGETGYSAVLPGLGSAHLPAGGPALRPGAVPAAAS